MINNSINFTSRDIYFKKAPAKKEVIEEAPKQTVEGTDDDDNYYENLFKNIEKEDKRVRRNVITGALLAASLIASPFALAEIDNSDCEFYNPAPHTTCVVESDYDKAVIEAAGILAQGGKNPNVLEYREFKNLIDYSALDCIPNYSTRETAKQMATIVYNPVDMNSADAKENILKQVKDIQRSIDKAAENYMKNPPKSYYQMRAEYAMKYITDREILENVDFSELEYYQHDITVLRHLINSSREKIERNAPDAEQKKQKAIDDAQKLVNRIVEKYQMKASVHGNYNADDVLTKGELASLLNMQSLKGLPEELQYRIIAKAVENYKPMDVRYATDKKQVERTNEKVDEEVKKAQKELDKWALKAQDQFFPILHPNEIKVTPREMTTAQVLSFAE